MIGLKLSAQNELASTVEQLGQSLLAVRAVEHVLLVNRLPGEVPTLAAQRVAQACELLLLDKQLLARLDPVGMGDDPVLSQQNSLDSARHSTELCNIMGRKHGQQSG